MGNNIFCLNFCLNVFFFKLDYVIFNLIFILELQKLLSQIEKYHSFMSFRSELQKLSQIEKYHSFMKYIAFRAQIWGIIFASTFASMYFSSS